MSKRKGTEVIESLDSGRGKKARGEVLRHKPIVDFVLGEGNGSKQARESLLRTATDAGNAKVVRLLLENRVFDSAEFDHLCTASAKGHLEIVKEFSKRVDEKDYDYCTGWSPLEIASKHGCLDVVKFLVGKGHLVERRASPQSALHSAVIGGHLDVVEFLVLEAGAVATNIRHTLNSGHFRNGGTVIDAAIENSHRHISKFLMENVDDLNWKGEYLPYITDELRKWRSVCERKAICRQLSKDVPQLPTRMIDIIVTYI